jgi:hypothetical protein
MIIIVDELHKKGGFQKLVQMSENGWHAFSRTNNDLARQKLSPARSTCTFPKLEARSISTFWPCLQNVT